MEPCAEQIDQVRVTVMWVNDDEVRAGRLRLESSLLRERGINAESAGCSPGLAKCAPRTKTTGLSPRSPLMLDSRPSFVQLTPLASGDQTCCART